MRISDWSSDVCSSDLQSPDPEWNAKYCRNRRNFMDEATRRAVESDKEAMLVTYRMDLGQGRYLPVKNVFVPLYVNGRQIGRASCRKECVSTCRSRWSPYH